MFVCAFFIARTFEDDSLVYPYHMLLGISMSFIVLLRFVWGFIGSRHARFASFRLKPKELFKYLKDILYSKTQVSEAHNPASSWVALIMMFLALGLAVTGYLMTVKIYKEVFEEVHELLANAFLIATILHISGIILHTIRYKDGIGISMLNGKKSIQVSENIEISHSYRFAGVVFFIIFLSFIVFLNFNYNIQKQNFTIYNQSLQLGEAEENEK